MLKNVDLDAEAMESLCEETDERGQDLNETVHSEGHSRQLQATTPFHRISCLQAARPIVPASLRQAALSLVIAS